MNDLLGLMISQHPFNDVDVSHFASDQGNSVMQPFIDPSHITSTAEADNSIDSVVE